MSINSSQFDFNLGRGTTDAIFIVSQMQEKYLAKNKDLYFTYINLEKTFDHVPRNCMLVPKEKASALKDDQKEVQSDLSQSQRRGKYWYEQQNFSHTDKLIPGSDTESISHHHNVGCSKWTVFRRITIRGAIYYLVIQAGNEKELQEKYEWWLANRVEKLIVLRERVRERSCTFISAVTNFFLLYIK